MPLRLACTVLFTLVLTEFVAAGQPPARTTMSDPSIRYRVPQQPYALIKRADIEAVIVDNSAVDDEVLPGHKAGLSGIGLLKHTARRKNVYLPLAGGLNSEFFYDGTMHGGMEPRGWPMELRVVDQYRVELYQKSTPHYALESCLRYQLLEEGVIEMTAEFIPHRPSFKHGYIGLFFASYIHQPESLDIHFKGYPLGRQSASHWIRSAAPVPKTDRPTGEGMRIHPATDDRRTFAHDAEYSCRFVYRTSQYRYSQPWFYGVSHGMALVQVFRPKDKIRMVQVPSGGGKGNPAWDFQYVISDYKVDQRYQLVMRLMYLPYESPEQLERAIAPYRSAF